MIDFDKYDRDNPQIWEMFVELTKEAKKKGFQHYSANGIFEQIRWHTGIVAEGESYKISNNYRPDYARKMMNTFPEFRGFFRIKQLQQEREPQEPTDLFGEPVHNL